MRKHLIIAGIICAASIPPATAVTKCVALGSNTTCTARSANYRYQPDWSITCNTNGKSISVQGVSMCSSTAGSSYYTTATQLDRSSMTRENEYCWCKMTSPAVSRWVYVYANRDGANCFYSCASECEQLAGGTAAYRSTLFRNLSD